jgi:hypothetical protein
MKISRIPSSAQPGSDNAAGSPGQRVSTFVIRGADPSSSAHCVGIEAAGKMMHQPPFRLPTLVLKEDLFEVPLRGEPKVARVSIAAARPEPPPGDAAPRSRDRAA